MENDMGRDRDGDGGEKWRERWEAKAFVDAGRQTVFISFIVHMGGVHV